MSILGQFDFFADFPTIFGTAQGPDVTLTDLEIAETIVTPYELELLSQGPGGRAPTRITELDLTTLESREDTIEAMEDLGYVFYRGQLISSPPLIGESTAAADAAAQASSCPC